MSFRLLNLFAAIFLALALASVATDVRAHGGHGHEASVAASVSAKEVIPVGTAVHAAAETARVAVAPTGSFVQLESHEGSQPVEDGSHPCSHVSCFSCHGTAVVQVVAALPKLEFKRLSSPNAESFWRSAVQLAAEQPPKPLA